MYIIVCRFTAKRLVKCMNCLIPAISTTFIYNWQEYYYEIQRIPDTR